MLSKRKRPRREEKQVRERKKIESHVFDRDTLLVLGGFIAKGVLASVDYPIAEGKEAVVFRATAGESAAKYAAAQHIAVKVYKIETSNFQRMDYYITGDVRFHGVKRTKRELVFAWCKKEFRNLQRCAEAGARVPAPYAFRRNALLMEFLGEEGIPDTQLKGIELEQPQQTLDAVLDDIRRMHGAGFVHGDVSEYNVLMHRGEPYLIDRKSVV
jgi:RIO kinase 1